MQWLYPLLKSHISLSKISGEARSEKRTSYNRTKYKKRAELRNGVKKIIAIVTFVPLEIMNRWS